MVRQECSENIFNTGRAGKIKSKNTVYVCTCFLMGVGDEPRPAATLLVNT